MSGVWKEDEDMMMCRSSSSIGAYPFNQELWGVGTHTSHSIYAGNLLPFTFCFHY